MPGNKPITDRQVEQLKHLLDVLCRDYDVDMETRDHAHDLLTMVRKLANRRAKDIHGNPA